MPEQCPNCKTDMTDNDYEHRGVPALVILNYVGYHEESRKTPHDYFEVRLFRCPSCGFISLFEW